METLSKELLAVVALYASSSSLEGGKDGLLEAIEKNAPSLDAIGAQGTEGSLSDDVRAGLACKASQLIFGVRAVEPKDPLYKGERQENWSMTCWLPAACFLRVQTPLDVAVALRLVTILRSKFAVRGNGHNANPGFSSVDNSGVLIDTGAIDFITLSQDKSFVSLRPGASWDQVYEQLEQQELTVTGGRVKGVGVGGLILGGGMSHFSNHWGLVADNLKNVEIVLADSTIVQVNATSHPDLFKALKGGGPNFGIVTRYDLYTSFDYRLWYTMRVYNASEKDRVMKAAVEVENAMEKDDKIGFFLSVAPGTLTAGMLYRGQADFPDAFRAFDGIPVMMEAIPPTNGTQLDMAKATAIDGIKKYETGALTVKPDPALYAELHTILQNIAKAPNVTLLFTFQPLGAAAVAKGKSNGGNVANIPAEQQSWLAIITQWADDADDAVARSQISQLIGELASAARSRGLLLDFLFQNDASYTQSPLKSYGPESLEYITKIASKYDPTGVFQTLQNSGFLVSKA
ncbi:FAD-binding domain-containing protein [Byssothecium circinans]|uniref:FAD-binding domain-containing protein n=1 Tax=Byssothecium circinans TaxID=147558 RepID=A0A6A5U6L6_9PLEO|nr:FAD-binding domain-containing protein [Byssothecium circinans]